MKWYCEATAPRNWSTVYQSGTVIILEVLGAGEGVHYRVRWEDGHESEFFPSAGSATIIHKAKEAGVP